jgi:tetratricopeptide (TPR) repeat protein
VGGEKLPDVPLFVLTGNYTFSGAEEFSYNMQTQKRATLVGETTGGGANPGGMVPINEKLAVFIPMGAAINPITKTNWEGVGVAPEVQAPAAEALDKATELAAKAADDFRQKKREKYKALLLDLYTQLDKQTGGSEEALLASLKKCHQARLLDEQDINGMGYEYLMQHRKPKTAQAIFYCNTALFPSSANCYDSYAEALLANGQAAKAVEAYRKAVDLAKTGKDPNLELFKENLKKAEAALVNKP